MADERREMAACLDRLAHGGTVIVENRRDAQRGHLEAAAGNRHFVHEHVRPLDASPGYHRYRFEPSTLDRATARLRAVIRGLWFPRGVRLWRRLHARLTGRPAPVRDAVAPGAEEYA